VADSIGLQGELATQIATALKAKLAPEEKARLDARPTTNSEAYMLYLTGLGTADDIEAEQVYMQAIALDPGFAPAYARASMRNRGSAFQAGNNHLFMRDWPAAAADYNRALEISPDFVRPKIGLAYLEVFRNGNPAAGRKILQDIPAGINPNGMVIMARWDLAMLDRDYATAERIVADSPLEDFRDLPKTYYQGRIALARGDIESAQRYFAATRPDAEKRVR